MSFLRPLLCLTRLDHQRNPEIHNGLKVDSYAEDVKLFQKNWLHHLKRMDTSRLLPLSCTCLGDGEIWKDLDEDGDTKNTLSLKEQVLRPIH